MPALMVSDVHPRGKVFPGPVIIDSLTCCRYFHTSSPQTVSQPWCPKGSRVWQHPWVAAQQGHGVFSPPGPSFQARGNPTLRRSCQLTLVYIPWLWDRWAQVFKQMWNESS